MWNRDLNMTKYLSDTTLAVIVEDAIRISLAQALSASATNTAIAISNNVVMIDKVKKEDFEYLQHEVRTQIKNFLEMGMKCYKDKKRKAIEQLDG